MWLLEKSVRDSIESAMRSGFKPNAQQEADFSARLFQSQADGGSRILSVAGDQAEIEIKGALTSAPNFFAALFGGGNTTYGEINAAIAAAEANPEVKKIAYAIDSPGGEFDGMFSTIEAMRRVTKPTKVIGINKVASAAFAIASQADTIEAENAATRFGSVGVVAGFFVDESVVEITSSNAPKKRPDVTTPEGKAVVVEQLDAMERVFMEAIATGRKTTVDKIIANYGQGATVLAGEALSRGMIDSVAKPALAVVKAAKPNTAPGGNRSKTAMDLKELKAQHPETYAAAVQEGISQERDRVSAHLVMGDASGDMKTAIGAIKDGSQMTATLSATYLAAGMNRSDRNARAADETTIAAATTAAAAGKGSEGVDPQEAFATAVLAQMGEVQNA